MQKESLDQAIKVILESIERLEIDNYDKLELMLNIYHFLENYHENVRYLNENIKRRKS